MTSTNPTRNEKEELTEAQKKMQFDEKLNQMFRETSFDSFLKVPELRSVIVVFDYFRNLNDAEGISKGLWLHTSGNKDKPADSISGSIGATLAALFHMIDEQMQQHIYLTQELTELTKQVVAKKKELENLK